MFLLFLLLSLAMGLKATFDEEQKTLLTKASELYNSYDLEKLMADVFAKDAEISDTYGQFEYKSAQIVEVAKKLKRKDYISVENTERDFGKNIAIYVFKNSKGEFVSSYQFDVTFTTTENGLRIQKAQRVIILDN